MTLLEPSKRSSMNLNGRDFIELTDYSTDEIHYLIDLAIELKRKQKNGEVYQPLRGKTVGLIFEKSSTRTRVSFEVGTYQLGGHALFLSKNDIQLGRGETIADTAGVMSRYLDGIMIRTFGHDKVVDLARYATVPVINGLSDLAHPCQVLADYQTLYEHKGKLQGLKLAYVGDGNNMAHSLMIGGAKLGVHVSVASPEGYEPDPQIVADAQEIAKATGAVIEVVRDPKAAVQEADAITPTCGQAWALKKSRRSAKRPSAITRSTSSWRGTRSRIMSLCTACRPTGARK